MQSNLENLESAEKKAAQKTLKGWLVAMALAVLGSFVFLGVAPWEIFSRIDQTARLFTELSRPTIGNLENAIGLLVETLLMAVSGTFLGTMAAVPLGFLASKAMGTGPIIRRAAKLIIVCTRAVPSLIFALILVRVLGFGPFVGALALGLSSIGMIGRQITDTLDNLAPSSREVQVSLGLSRFQFAFAVLLPSIFSSVIATVLYRLEINVRSSSVLGFVGAGGIGILLLKDLGQLNYGGAMGTTLLILFTVMIFENISSRVRSQLTSREAPKGNALVSGHLDPAAGFYIAPMFFFAASFASLMYLLPQGRVREADLGAIANLLSKAWPPNFVDFGDILVSGLLETFAMALAGTALGAVFAVPFAYFAASNLSPNSFVSNLARAAMSGIRSLPDLVVALFFVVAVGLGPVSGVYTIAFGTAGILGRMLADVFEDTDAGIRDTFVAMGISSTRLFISGVIPENSLRLSATVLHVLDINIRIAISLGVVGVGGIGMLLQGAVSALAFDTAFAILLVIVLAVVILEALSSRIKSHLQ